MHSLTKKRVEKFAAEFGFGGNIAEQFELYVAATYLHKYLQDKPELIERVVLGGGEDEGIDAAAVIVNGQIVFEPQEIEELIEGRADNTAKVIFIQSKTSERYDTKLVAKFLHGVEAVTKFAHDRNSVDLPPLLVDIATLIETISVENDKFQDSGIPCEIFYVTTSSSDGKDVFTELQVTEALGRIDNLGIYAKEFKFEVHGQEGITAKVKERFGPQNVRFYFEKRLTIPSADELSEAYIGLLKATEVLNLLTDETGEMRPGIFEDNVRLDLGAKNPVNQRIMATLDGDDRPQFPLLNNGLTIIASNLKITGDRFSISGYQIVNGGQTSHQLVRWKNSLQSDADLLSDLWIPVKIVASTDPHIRSSVAIATNLQTAISATDVQGSSQIAKDVEEFFKQSGLDGLRYERQSRGIPIGFPRTRVVGTTELNRAVASVLFGDSSRAIASPKELENDGSFVWGDYPLEAYYYAAWILYRIERYFGRVAEYITLKPAKYHIAMMVSAMLVPNLIEIFTNDSKEVAASKLRTVKPHLFNVRGDQVSEKIEASIVEAVKLCSEYFSDALSRGGSLRRDDVRNVSDQKTLLSRAEEAMVEDFV